MSAHVLELLSAYLDDELVPADRSAIDLHLRECAGCSRRLEEIAALDGLARALPAEAPEGYFDDFSARVRAKVSLPASGRTRPHVPAWTLAAAAALLLAVLTPGLLERQAATPPAAPTPTVADSFAAAKPAQLQVEGRLESEAGPPVTLALDAAADKKLDRSRDADLPKPSAAEQDRAKERGALAKEAPKDVREELALGYAEAPQEKMKAEARADAPAVASVPEPASVEGAAPEAPPAAAASGLRGGAFTAEAESKTAARRQNQAAAAPPVSAFQQLLDRRVSTAAEARSLREAWRAHAATAPAGEADEARVRAIEAGALAARLSREASDLTQLRKDVADYVARADALQSSRARAVLRAAEAAGR